MKKILAIVLAVIILATSLTGCESSEVLSVLRYTYAEKLLEEGDYEKAVSFFELIPDYKDSAKRIEDIKYEIMLSRYGDIIALLEKGTWFFNGGDDAVLNVITFSKNNASVSQYYYDGNGKHDNGTKNYSYILDDSIITVSMNGIDFDIPYKVSGNKISLGKGDYYSIDEIDEKLQGYWKDRHSDYILGISTESEYNVLIENGKITFESASKAYNKKDKYYYYGPDSGRYSILKNGFENTAPNSFQWGFNVIDGEVVLMHYDRPCRRTNGFPGKKGYSFG